MSNEPVNQSTGKFTMSDDIFLQPGLDIYTQMAYIILKNFSTESNIPELSDISKLGRMDVKQTMKALQSLVELKFLSHKVFRRMVGDFRDDRLSWAAKGLLVFCKDNPQINFQDLLELASESGEDEHSIRKALNELSQYGYLEQYPEWSQIVN
jgi:DNA-binding MarR family transcriptional regulator